MPVVDALVAVAIVVLVAVVITTALSQRSGATDAVVVAPKQRTVSDRHRHRWTRWEVVDERRIHLYGEVDEGRGLPDRIDVVLRRECARCGLPQTQTVRGLDPKLRD